VGAMGSPLVEEYRPPTTRRQERLRQVRQRWSRGLG